MNYSCLDSHVESKPRGETRMVPEVHSVANPSLFYLCSNLHSLIVPKLDFVTDSGYSNSHSLVFMTNVRIAGNFRGTKYSWLRHFVGNIFVVAACTAGFIHWVKIFVVRPPTTKTTKITRYNLS